MSKYPSGHTVGAIYEGSSGNPYLDAMPDMFSPEQFAQAVASYPPIPHDLAQMSPEERRGLLPSLASIYVPIPYQYAIYDTLCSTSFQARCFSARAIHLRSTQSCFKNPRFSSNNSRFQAAKQWFGTSQLHYRGVQGVVGSRQCTARGTGYRYLLDVF